MEHFLGLTDSLLVALAMGAEGIRQRVDAAGRVGVTLVTCAASPASARAMLARIGRAPLSGALLPTDGRLRLPGVPSAAALLLPVRLEPTRFVALLARRGITLSSRELAAGYQAAELALHGVRDVLAADNGNLGAVRKTLAAVEPFAFLATGSFACRDGVAALSLAAPPPRSLLAS